MKALTEGRYRGRDGIWAVFDLGWSTELRVGILEQDIGAEVVGDDGQGGPARLDHHPRDCIRVHHRDTASLE